MAERADAIVVGLGAMGAATLYQLARMDKRVIGIDQYYPPHPHGSTHGDTRITRLGIGEGAEYVPLAMRSHQIWQEIAKESRQQILYQPGTLIMAEGENQFLEQTIASAAAHGIENHLLDADQISAQYPMFKTHDDTRGYFEPQGGYLLPERAVRNQLKLAKDHGAVLRLGEKTISWSASDHGVRVATTMGEYHADQLILAGGPWMSRLVPELAPILSVYRQMLYWFALDDHSRADYARWQSLPAWIWESSGQVDDLMGPRPDFIYGFPALDGSGGGMKIASEDYIKTGDPDSGERPARRSEMRHMWTERVQPRIRGLEADPIRTLSCWYTATPNGRFLIDRHPEHPQVMLVSPCSGHGFKHSAAIGEAVAQQVAHGTSQIDLSAWSFAQAAASASATS